MRARAVDERLLSVLDQLVRNSCSHVSISLAGQRGVHRLGQLPVSDLFDADTVSLFQVCQIIDAGDRRHRRQSPIRWKEDSRLPKDLSRPQEDHQPTQFVAVGWNVCLESLASAVGRYIDGPATQALHDDWPLQMLAHVEGRDRRSLRCDEDDVRLFPVACEFLQLVLGQLEIFQESHVDGR